MGPSFLIVILANKDIKENGVHIGEGRMWEGRGRGIYIQGDRNIDDTEIKGMHKITNKE